MEDYDYKLNEAKVIFHHLGLLSLHSLLLKSILCFSVYPLAKVTTTIGSNHLIDLLNEVGHVVTEGYAPASHSSGPLCRAFCDPMPKSQLLFHLSIGL